MAVDRLDAERIDAALKLASGSIGLTDPNPRVGCIIGWPDGRVIGRGATQAAGASHAEVMALEDARRNGHATAGATAWVTLEPCAHHGRTPPCCDALLAAGIARCVVAMQDPFPQVAGAGIARLRAAGVDVQLIDDPTLQARARELNVGFFSRIERGRPWVRMKLASSLDGRAALLNGQSQWITSEAARADGHAWRKRASAVLTGIGTVLADNPRLDVRAVSTPRQPLRVVVDSHLRTPVDAAILRPPGAVLVVCAGAADAGREAALLAAGAAIHRGAATAAGVDLPALAVHLAEKGVNELHIEAGPRLSGAWLQADLVDELLVYIAPTLLGPGRPTAALPELEVLAQARRYEWLAIDRVGDDLRFRLRRAAGNAAAQKITNDAP